jgi:hypothetical protein
MKNAVSLQDVEVGDGLIRMLGGSVPMHVVVTRADENFIYCATPCGRDEWTFERPTGVEYDPELHWGSSWGATGSMVTEVIKRSKE